MSNVQIKQEQKDDIQTGDVCHVEILQDNIEMMLQAAEYTVDIMHVKTELYRLIMTTCKSVRDRFKDQQPVSDDISFVVRMMSTIVDQATDSVFALHGKYPNGPLTKKRPGDRRWDVESILKKIKTDVASEPEDGVRLRDTVQPTPDLTIQITSKPSSQ
jgi:hypothetical protein